MCYRKTVLPSANQNEGIFRVYYYHFKTLYQKRVFVAKDALATIVPAIQKGIYVVDAYVGHCFVPPVDKQNRKKQFTPFRYYSTYILIFISFFTDSVDQIFTGLFIVWFTRGVRLQKGRNKKYVF